MMRYVLVSCLVFAASCHGDSIETRPLRGWSPYIINGEPAEPGEFPSMVSLQYKHTVLHHMCGASIISADWVVTAAQCIKKDDDIKLMYFLAGSHDLDNPGSSHAAERFVLHEEFDATAYWYLNDIAVVKVTPPFNLSNPLTQPIKLPAQGQATADGSIATVIGWGRVAEGVIPPKQLRKVDVAIVNQEVCSSIYEPRYTLYPTQICADIPQAHVGTCSDDSGGPLFVNEEFVGIVSWPEYCAIQGYPTVYTRVSSFRDWIATTTGV